MGIIMMVGIVVEYSVILVDFANRLQGEGVSVEEAVVQAAHTRLRPILMTSLTTTFALLREHHPCAEGYEKLARHLGGVPHYGVDTPIPLAVILESNELADTLWSLRAMLLAATSVEVPTR